MEKINKKTKLLIVSLIIFVCALVLTAIIQTYVIKSKQNELSMAQKSNTELEQIVDNAKTESEYKEDEDYYDDYVEHEGPYGDDGDKIVDIND